MQDRSYVVAIVVILAICCLGVYVAFTGFWNSNPYGPATNVTSEPRPATLIVVVIPTDTPAPTRAGAPTSPPPPVASVPPPLGVIETVPPGASPAVVAGSPTPTVRLTASPTASPPPPLPPPSVNQPCGGMLYCPAYSPPDRSIEVGGDACPRNYILGRITDIGGRGLANVRIRFRIPSGETSETVSKSSGSELGKYDIPALGSSPTVWTVWLLDNQGVRASPEVAVTVPQVYSGSGNCPTRVDFKAQR